MSKKKTIGECLICYSKECFAEGTTPNGAGAARALNDGGFRTVRDTPFCEGGRGIHKVLKESFKKENGINPAESWYILEITDSKGEFAWKKSAKKN